MRRKPRSSDVRLARALVDQAQEFFAKALRRGAATPAATREFALECSVAYQLAWMRKERNRSRRLGARRWRRLWDKHSVSYVTAVQQLQAARKAGR